MNKCIIHHKNSSSKTFVVNFFIYKLALLIFIYHLLDISLNYSDCPITVKKCILFYLLISDDNVIGQVLNLLSPITFVYKSFKNKTKRILYILQCYFLVKYFIERFLNLLLQHGDIETNPGPRGNHSQYFSFCHWNLNSLPVHNYAKVHLLQAFNAIHKLDLICLSESYLNSSITSDEKSLVIECLVYELSIQNKKGYFVILYRSPSQSHDDFETFLKEFDKLLTNITKKRSDLVIVNGDFNAKSTTWWSGDTNTVEGTNIEALTSYHGFEQVINEPAHILPNSFSCIDLIFADKPNLIVESGVLPSLHVINCHHQLIYSKLNLNVIYPLPYQRLVWDYKKANADCIKKSLNSVDWDFPFSNNNVHQHAQYLNKVLMNVFTNYIPNRLITIGVLPSLHVINCHHQLIYSKLNLNVIYPLPYQRLVWDYKKANADCIKKSLNSVDWDFPFSNNNVHQQAQYLNKVLMNVFTNYIPNRLITIGVLPSLHVINCHHQLIYSKLNLNVIYPLPYQRLVWDYKKANADCIKKSLNSVDWDFPFSNNNVHQQAQYLNKVLMNVFTNYIPNRLITIDDKDPPWMNDEIRNKIKETYFINN